MLVRTLKAGHSFIEVPMHIQPRRYGQSSALSVRNVVTAAGTIARLFVELRLGASTTQQARRV
jgi:hypothetical protein